MSRHSSIIGISIAGCVVAGSLVWGDDNPRGERRAPAPKVSTEQLRGIFFDDLDEAIRGQRPSLSSLRKASEAKANEPTKTQQPDQSSADSWAGLISPVSLEDEIKRVRLHFDSIITTPGAFNSGGYQDARLDLSVLAMLFAVIQQHSGDVRWKDEAGAARDLLARTAFNCKAGSTQVYNEAKLRKADLQDLVSGTGLASREAEPENVWSEIADRSPLMEYAERLVDSLEGNSRDAASIESNIDAVKRDAELIAMLGEVLTKEGMDEADDDDYVKLSRNMTADSKKVVAAIERADFEGARAGVSQIRGRCDACHEQYR
ncbi:cytochrome c [Rubripirellula reticaptiva]|uniref:Cytochrome C n=1 Tax=Rubripirellula reticaptiva TaxID=2528013 RepID=A0A5C6FB22_9BACT|nr:cytochrome c [Rubripirellula reticaptiva]TWU57750.1 Cytochrome C' [Rubripirellula reticaptiva]